MTFKQFLHEEYKFSVNSAIDTYEVFKNPTPAELKLVKGVKAEYKGLIGDGGDFYAWGTGLDYDSATHGQVLRKGSFYNDKKPIAFYFYPDRNKVEVSVWSMNALRTSWKVDSRKDLKEIGELVKNNKNLKRWIGSSYTVDVGNI